MARRGELQCALLQERIRIAMVRRFSNAEIMTAEQISRNTLYRYQKKIKILDLEFLEKITGLKAKNILLQQIRVVQDVILQANRWSHAHPHSNPNKLLRVVLKATEDLVNWMFRLGSIKEMPQEFLFKAEMKSIVIRKQIDIAVSHIITENPKLAEEIKIALKNLPELKIIE